MNYALTKIEASTPEAEACQPDQENQCDQTPHWILLTTLIFAMTFMLSPLILMVYLLF